MTPWWCQVVAVAYEHERGIRQQFQKCDGAFSASGSRTIDAPLAKVMAAWTDEKLRGCWLPEAPMDHDGEAGQVRAREMEWRHAAERRILRDARRQDARGCGP